MPPARLSLSPSQLFALLLSCFEAGVGKLDWLIYSFLGGRYDGVADGLDLNSAARPTSLVVNFYLCCSFDNLLPTR
jgi:hypothetical protein